MDHDSWPGAIAPGYPSKECRSVPKTLEKDRLGALRGQSPGPALSAKPYLTVKLLMQSPLSLRRPRRLPRTPSDPVEQLTVVLSIPLQYSHTTRQKNSRTISREDIRYLDWLPETEHGCSKHSYCKFTSRRRAVSVFGSPAEAAEGSTRLL